MSGYYNNLHLQDQQSVGGDGNYQQFFNSNEAAAEGDVTYVPSPYTMELIPRPVLPKQKQQTEIEPQPSSKTLPKYHHRYEKYTPPVSTLWETIWQYVPKTVLIFEIFWIIICPISIWLWLITTREQRENNIAAAALRYVIIYPFRNNSLVKWFSSLILLLIPIAFSFSAFVLRGALFCWAKPRKNSTQSRADCCLMSDAFNPYRKEVFLMFHRLWHLTWFRQKHTSVQQIQQEYAQLQNTKPHSRYTIKCSYSPQYIAAFPPGTLPIDPPTSLVTKKGMKSKLKGIFSSQQELQTVTYQIDLPIVQGATEIAHKNEDVASLLDYFHHNNQFLANTVEIRQQLLIAPEDEYKALVFEQWLQDQYLNARHPQNPNMHMFEQVELTSQIVLTLPPQHFQYPQLPQPQFSTQQQQYHLTNNNTTDTGGNITLPHQFLKQTPIPDDAIYQTISIPLKIPSIKHLEKVNSSTSCTDPYDNQVLQYLDPKADGYAKKSYVVIRDAGMFSLTRFFCLTRLSGYIAMFLPVLSCCIPFHMKYYNYIYTLKLKSKRVLNLNFDSLFELSNNNIPQQQQQQSSTLSPQIPDILNNLKTQFQDEYHKKYKNEFNFDMDAKNIYYDNPNNHQQFLSDFSIASNTQLVSSPIVAMSALNNKGELSHTLSRMDSVIGNNNNNIPTQSQTSSTGLNLNIPQQQQQQQQQQQPRSHIIGSYAAPIAIDINNNNNGNENDKDYQPPSYMSTFPETPSSPSFSREDSSVFSNNTESTDNGGKQWWEQFEDNSNTNTAPDWWRRTTNAPRNVYYTHHHEELTPMQSPQRNTLFQPKYDVREFVEAGKKFKVSPPWKSDKCCCDCCCIRSPRCCRVKWIEFGKAMIAGMRSFPLLVLTVILIQYLENSTPEQKAEWTWDVALKAVGPWLIYIFGQIPVTGFLPFVYAKFLAQNSQKVRHNEYHDLTLIAGDLSGFFKSFTTGCGCLDKKIKSSTNQQQDQFGTPLLNSNNHYNTVDSSASTTTTSSFNTLDPRFINQQDVLERIQEMEKAIPILSIVIECFHIGFSTELDNRAPFITMKNFNSKNITHREVINIPINSSYIVSQSGEDFIASTLGGNYDPKTHALTLPQMNEKYIGINYKTDYRLHPTQQHILDLWLKLLFKYYQRFDQHCQIKLEYTTIPSSQYSKKVHNTMQYYKPLNINKYYKNGKDGIALWNKENWQLYLENSLLKRIVKIKNDVIQPITIEKNNNHNNNSIICNDIETGNNNNNNNNNQQQQQNEKQITTTTTKISVKQQRSAMINNNNTIPTEEQGEHNNLFTNMSTDVNDDQYNTNNNTTMNGIDTLASISHLNGDEYDNNMTLNFGDQKQQQQQPPQYSISSLPVSPLATTTTTATNNQLKQLEHEYTNTIQFLPGDALHNIPPAIQIKENDDIKRITDNDNEEKKKSCCVRFMQLLKTIIIWLLTWYFPTIVRDVDPEKLWDTPVTTHWFKSTKGSCYCSCGVLPNTILRFLSILFIDFAPLYWIAIWCSFGIIPYVVWKAESIKITYTETRFITLGNILSPYHYLHLILLDNTINGSNNTDNNHYQQYTKQLEYIHPVFKHYYQRLFITQKMLKKQQFAHYIKKRATATIKKTNQNTNQLQQQQQQQQQYNDQISITI